MTHAPQVEPDHYGDLRYDTKERFLSYWHQIQQVMARQPQDVLEIGIGNGFVHRYLRQHEITVHTMDFDERLGPDTQGSVLEIPFDEGAFDLVACFETLEHLPYEDFATALGELRRVARRWVLLSLPDVTPYVRFDVALGHHKRGARALQDLPDPNPRVHRFDGQHYWEIGKRGFELEVIRGAVEAAGLVIEDDFRVFELPYHRFLSCAIR